MDTSIFLAKFWGWFMILFFFLLILYPKRIKQLFTFARDDKFIISLSILTIIIGLLNVDMSWGLMIQLANNQGYLLQGGRYWWMVFPAGLAVTFIAMAFFLVGRAMDEVVNPRLRKR